MTNLATHVPEFQEGDRRCVRDVGEELCGLLLEEHLDDETVDAVVDALRDAADEIADPDVDAALARVLEAAGFAVPSEDRLRGVVARERDDDPSPETRAMAGPLGSPRATPDDDVDASRDDARQATTDWKEIADMQHAFITGMMAGAAHMHGKDVRAAIKDAEKMRDELVKEATR